MRSVALLTWLVALLAVLASCSTYRTLATADSQSMTAPPGKEGVRITGYTTTDGVYHRFEGSVRIDGDSLQFHAPAIEARGLELPKPEKSFRMALTEVTSVNSLAGTNVIGTVLLVAAITGVVFVFAAAGAMSSEESMM